MNQAVLIVEDNDDLRELTAMRFEMAGIPTQQCRNGIEALSALTPHGPNILVCDMKMPRMSGHDLLKQVRDAGGTQLFIFFSGSISPRQITEMSALGVYGFIEKGSCEGLVELVKSAQASILSAALK